MMGREIEHLSPDACWQLLARGSTGRLVFTDEDGPMALPMNYAVVERSLVVRLADGAAVQALRAHPSAAFEIDGTDEDDSSGWSVVARGTADVIEPDAIPGWVHRAKGKLPRPWADGIHNVWVTLSPTSVSGRSLGQHHTEQIF